MEEINILQKLFNITELNNNEVKSKILFDIHNKQNLYEKRINIINNFNFIEKDNYNIEEILNFLKDNLFHPIHYCLLKKFNYNTTNIIKKFEYECGYYLYEEFLLNNDNYNIYFQYPIQRYKVDYVVENKLTLTKIAIEIDEKHHKYIDEEERNTIIELSGLYLIHISMENIDNYTEITKDFMNDYLVLIKKKLNETNLKVDPQIQFLLDKLTFYKYNKYKNDNKYKIIIEQNLTKIFFEPINIDNITETTNIIEATLINKKCSFKKGNLYVTINKILKKTNLYCDCCQIVSEIIINDQNIINNQHIINQDICNNKNVINNKTIINQNIINRNIINNQSVINNYENISIDKIYCDLLINFINDLTIKNCVDIFLYIYKNKCFYENEVFTIIDNKQLTKYNIITYSKLIFDKLHDIFIDIFKKKYFIDKKKLLLKKIETNIFKSNVINNLKIAFKDKSNKIDDNIMNDDIDNTFFEEFIKNTIEFTDNNDDYIKWIDLLKIYNEWYNSINKKQNILKKDIIKTKFEKLIFKCKCYGFKRKGIKIWGWVQFRLINISENKLDE